MYIARFTIGALKSAETAEFICILQLCTQFTDGDGNFFTNYYKANLPLIH